MNATEQTKPPTIPPTASTLRIVHAPMPETESLWRVKELAEYLKKSPRWVWERLKLSADQPGSIPHYRVGDSPRFAPGLIRQWVMGNCPPAATLEEWQIERTHTARKST